MKYFKKIIHNGGVAVIQTDTLYGLVADARNEKSINRIYKIKKRDPSKPFIVLVADITQIKSFGVDISEGLEKVLSKYWPGKVSIILPVNSDLVNTYYLHRGTECLAFRIPAHDGLRALLVDVGPLVAPSANIEGNEPAKNIQQAIDYFGENVDYYMEGEDLTHAKPSTIVKISHGTEVEVIRP